MSELPLRISKRGDSYILRRYFKDKRVCFYSTNINELIEYDKQMDKGILPKKKRSVGVSFTEDKLNELLRKKDEQWKWIKGFVGLYAISNNGDVYSFRKNTQGKKLSIVNSNGWYLSFRAVNSDGEVKTIRVHQEVARCFIGDIPKGYHVHHKDDNKQNNNVSNLQILSAREHSLETIRQNPHYLDGMIAYNKNRNPASYRGVKQKRNKKFKHGNIEQYTLDGEFVSSYPTSVDAQRATGVCYRSILQVASKSPYNSKGSTRKQAGGFIWKYADEKGVV